MDSFAQEIADIKKQISDIKSDLLIVDKFTSSTINLLTSVESLDDVLKNIDTIITTASRLLSSMIVIPGVMGEVEFIILVLGQIKNLLEIEETKDLFFNKKYVEPTKSYFYVFRENIESIIREIDDISKRLDFIFGIVRYMKENEQVECISELRPEINDIKKLILNINLLISKIKTEITIIDAKNDFFKYLIKTIQTIETKPSVIYTSYVLFVSSFKYCMDIIGSFVWSHHNTDLKSNTKHEHLVYVKLNFKDEIDSMVSTMKDLHTVSFDLLKETKKLSMI